MRKFQSKYSDLMDASSPKDLYGHRTVKFNSQVTETSIGGTETIGVMKGNDSCLVKEPFPAESMGNISPRESVKRKSESDLPIVMRQNHLIAKAMKDMAQTTPNRPVSDGVSYPS